MSLIVARKYGDETFIVGDTRITDTLGSLPITPTVGTIKSIIPTADTCVSFAGNLHFAELALREFPTSSPRSVQISHLYKYHLESRNIDILNAATDFIIASTIKGVPLVTLKDGSIVESDSTWIGSESAFNRFQGYWTGQLNSSAQSPDTFHFSIRKTPEATQFQDQYLKMIETFDAVIKDESIPEVGDFLVPVTQENSRFRYNVYGDTVSHQIDFSKLPNGSAIPFGTAEEGGYSYDLTSSETSDYVAFYFLQGQFGLLFSPDENRILRPRVIYGNPLEFSELALEQTGFEFKSVFLNVNVYAAMGERDLKNGKFDRAVKYFSSALELLPKDAAIDRSLIFANRALCFRNLNVMDQALEDVEKATTINPDNAEYHYIKSCILHDLNQLEASIGAAVSANRLEPNNRDYQNLLADLILLFEK